MDVLSQTLYILSTGLMIPVMIFLIFYFIKTLILTGNFLNRYMKRQRDIKSVRSIVSKIEFHNINEFIEELLAIKSNLKEILGELTRFTSDTTKREKLIADYQLEYQKDVQYCKSLSKVGPMLGLMGTLIPMGPALLGLAKGDIASLAENMQLAFATTVVGLFIAVSTFVLQQIKQQQMTEDMNIVYYIDECISKSVGITIEA